MLADAAGWIAPVATMIAAMMTAANLGARITGWGFVVFAVGSVAWSIVGISSGQTNLLATNIFLTFVNLVGIWRWLGRQRVYEDGAEAAARRSSRAGGPSLFPATGIAGMPVSDDRGETVGHAVEALIECASGRVNYVVVASGGIAGIEEQLRSVAMAHLDCHSDGLILLESRAAFERRAPLERDRWPASAARSQQLQPDNVRRQDAGRQRETGNATA